MTDAIERSIDRLNWTCRCVPPYIIIIVNVIIVVGDGLTPSSDRSIPFADPPAGGAPRLLPRLLGERGALRAVQVRPVLLSLSSYLRMMIIIMALHSIIIIIILLIEDDDDDNDYGVAFDGLTRWLPALYLPSRYVWSGWGPTYYYYCYCYHPQLRG